MSIIAVDVDDLKKYHPFTPGAELMIQICQTTIAPEVRAEGGVEKLSKETDEIISLIRASKDRARAYYIAATVFRFLHAELSKIMAEGDAPQKSGG